jgi:hypothetical protein
METNIQTFDEFWDETGPLFNSVLRSSKMSAVLAWNAAIASAAEICRQNLELQSAAEILDLNPK